MDSNSSMRDCAIIGAGPAGLLLGLLMARAGLNVTVFEAHKDFDRDFRGDTVHASTLEVLDQISLADKVLALPHAKLRTMTIRTPQRVLGQFDLRRLPSKFPYVAVMPQADFLELLCAEAERYPNFECRRASPVQALVTDPADPNKRVLGVRFQGPAGEAELRASLTVAADGRFSKTRTHAGFTKPANGATIDVAWLRVSRQADDEDQLSGLVVSDGHVLVALPRDQQWQLGYVFPKGDFKFLREQGLPAFQQALARAAPWLGNRVEEIDDWSKVHLLAVGADRLDTWHKPGLLMIGDAAHVMSPIGGVGINAAIGDAVEAANVLANPRNPALASGPPSEDLLARVQQRRWLATRITQGIQAGIQYNITKRVLANEHFDLPLLAKLILSTPGLRNLPPRIVAMGFPKSRLRLS